MIRRYTKKEARQYFEKFWEKKGSRLPQEAFAAIKKCMVGYLTGERDTIPGPSIGYSEYYTVYFNNFTLVCWLENVNGRINLSVTERRFCNVTMKCDG